MNDEPLNYKFYKCHNWSLVGNNEDQIINTLKYYKFERGLKDKKYDSIQIPQYYEIEDRDKISIMVALPLANLMKDLEVKINSSVEFFVNRNAVDYLQGISNSYDKLKRGDLYKFNPGLDIFGVWFLPEDVMEGLKNYNWTPHQKQINSWFLERDNILEKDEKGEKLLLKFPNNLNN